jgi:hypothetical protein
MCVCVGVLIAILECKSEGATNAKEITAEAIEADLVYIDQAKRGKTRSRHASQSGRRRLHDLQMRGRTRRSKWALLFSRRSDPSPATTGVELGFTIHTSASFQIKAITAAEIEAKQHEDESAAAAAAKKRPGEEAAAATAAAMRQRRGSQIRTTQARPAVQHAQAVQEGPVKTQARAVRKAGQAEVRQRKIALKIIGAPGLIWLSESVWQ